MRYIIYTYGPGRMDRYSVVTARLNVDADGFISPDSEDHQTLLAAVDEVPGHYIIVCDQGPGVEERFPGFLYHLHIDAPRPRVFISSRRASA